MQTAKNLVEARKHAIKRAKCNAVKEEKNKFTLTLPGPSGPPKRVKWLAREDEKNTKREAQKQIALEKIRSIQQERKKK